MMCASVVKPGPAPVCHLPGMLQAVHPSVDHERTTGEHFHEAIHARVIQRGYRPILRGAQPLGV
eukprot:CAMPEP_0181133566 /NCGR_PEP_ID=MMETSP1071-20121207/31597_1 /TAXON_ID=35127 /ORGANISM="Thalassiosira sp., Strain NH16" /LENGTH=63 /DNA_ID=CAMNT_0023219975 /DNA_START=90 /DNA_END=278 /DNA_ORIENTATION=+